MTENQTTTNPVAADVTPPDAPTADALDSVATTEHPVTPDPAPAAEVPSTTSEADSAEDEETAENASSADEPAPTGTEGTSPDDEDDLAEGDDASAGTGDNASADDIASALADEPASTDDLASSDGDAPFGEEEGVLSGVEVVVDDETMRRALEAILMVTDEPLPALTLARTVGRPTGDVTNALNELAGEYTEQGRGFDLREVGGGWRYYTRADAAQYVERFVLDGQQSRLTQAALETLAVVAYKQPVSRARVSAIRGVNVDGVMRTLVSRGLVEEAGADTESQATLYRTTSYFLERMGMQGLNDLPELAPYLPEMDDMEEELAAQNAAATPASEPTADDEPTSASEPIPASGAPTAATEPTGDDEPTAASEPSAADDLVAVDEPTADDEPTTVDEPTADDDLVAVDEPIGDGEAGQASSIAELVAEDAGRDDELEPAEELEAGGEELDPDVDPAEIPAGEEDADGNDEDADGNDDADDSDDLDDDDEDDDDLDEDGPADFDAATGDVDDDVDLIDDEDEDDLDEDDESADERLEAAEDLEAAGAPEGIDEQPVAGGSQYGTEPDQTETEANDRNE